MQNNHKENQGEKKALLRITDLKQWFPIKKTKLFQKEQLYVRANDGITLDIYAGETVGLVGVRMWEIYIWKNTPADLSTDRRKDYVLWTFSDRDGAGLCRRYSKKYRNKKEKKSQNLRKSRKS